MTKKEFTTKLKTAWLKVRYWLIDALLVVAEIIGGLLMCLIFLLISITGVIYTFFKHVFWKRDYAAKRQFKPIMRAFTLVNDCFANAAGGELLNDLSGAREGEIKYGWFQQTISSVTGLRFIFNKRDSELRRVLNKIERDHCELAPSEMEMFYYTNAKQTEL